MAWWKGRRKPSCSRMSLSRTCEPQGEPPTALGTMPATLLLQQRPREQPQLRWPSASCPDCHNRTSGLAQKDRHPSWWPWSWSGTRSKERVGRTMQPTAVPHLPRSLQLRCSLHAGHCRPSPVTHPSSSAAASPRS